MSKLFSPLHIGSLTLKNRIVMPPMCMYTANSSGQVTDFHLVHYATRAMGGTGFIIVEATAVEPCGRISGNDLGLWDDSQIPGFKKLAQQIKEYGSVPGIQINHAGRKCAAPSEKVIYAPSAIAFNNEYSTPVEMTLASIQSTTGLFQASAQRAQQAGFEYLEIHAAHGYLLSEFLSPLANHRQDAYGGSPENRVRFLKEVLQATKSVFKGTIGVRISAHDYTKGGNTPEDLAHMLNLIKNLGIDLVHVSSGAVTDVVPPTYPGYQIPFAETVQHSCHLPVIAGGLLTCAETMEEIVSSNRAEMVFVGRELLRNPYFPLQAAHTLKADIQWPKSYERAKFRL